MCVCVCVYVPMYMYEMCVCKRAFSTTYMSGIVAYTMTMSYYTDCFMPSLTEVNFLDKQGSLHEEQLGMNYDWTMNPDIK